jgi:hypothetical protein
MMLVGTKTPYLSHLPMFHEEHRFQVILEARFDDGGDQVDRIYFDDRADNSDVRMYTVAPADLFKLSRLFNPGEAPERTGFAATVFRGHLERGGKRINGLRGIDVTVTRVVYARALEPDAERSDALRYILFGNDDELFLAHQITQAPDFDQIISVDVNGHSFAEDDLIAGVIVTIPDRDNTGEDRLRAGETATAIAVVGDSDEAIEVTVEVAAEPYFEDSELQVSPDMGTSELEQEAGF